MSIDTHFEDIQDKIATKLKAAEKQIIVAVAWLTDQRLFNILCDQSEKLIDVQVLILKDEINMKSNIDYERLIKSGGKLYWQENINNNLMHHKFCIIDKKTVLTGSYNWTNKAQSNFENIIILENEPDSSNKYLEEYKNLVPKFQDAIFFDSDYQPAEYFNTPQKRNEWFNKFPEEVQKTFQYYGRQLLYIYDEEGYVSYSEDLDENIDAILRMPKILFDVKHTLEPLKNLSNLKDLNTISHSKISNLDLTPLRNLINLEVLNLSGNKINDLTPLSKLKKLKRLNISNTKIDNLSGLENLSNLTDLDISKNNINSLDEIAKFTKLEYLSINDNNISNIDFLSMNKRLSEINMCNNKIKDISSLSNCGRLQKLNFTNNSVEDISSLQNLGCLLFVNGTKNLIPEEKIKKFKKGLRGSHYDYNIVL